METCLAMDSKTKHLNLNIKKRFEHSSDSQLKVRGVLDTVTAKGQFQAGLHKASPCIILYHDLTIQRARTARF
jgi:hypothetical protein